MDATDLENERQSLLRIQASRKALVKGWSPEDDAILRARLELCENYLARAIRKRSRVQPAFKVSRP